MAESDFIVSFLETFHRIFPSKLKEIFSKIDRQNTLLSFIKTADILIQKNLTGDDHFKQALIVKVLYVLRLAIESEDTVDMGIYCIQIILNAIGMKQTINYFSSVFSTVVHAFLKYPDHRKIKRYVQKIFEFYIKEKKANSLERYKDIQFIHLRELQKNSRI